jgi:hypothetical protein
MRKGSSIRGIIACAAFMVSVELARAQGGGGGYGSNGALTWNKAQTFTLAALAAAVSTSSPSGTIAARAGYDTPTFNWNAVAGTGHYFVWITDQTTNRTAVIDNNVSATSWTSSVPLTPGHTYTWWIGAFSTNGLALTWNKAQTFTLAALAAPVTTSAVPDR